MSNKSSNDIISLPKGGGALHGIGEKFSPDLHTGTGNFSFPIAIPAGRNGFQPQLTLGYSTGNGNGPFGLGWNLSIPAVSRKTSQGVPQYNETKDSYILSGAEELVPVKQEEKITHYRPRTEGLFAKILHHHDVVNNYWEVRSKDGMVSYYGTAAASGSDPAVIRNPANPKEIFAWKLSHTEDPFGSRIAYTYQRDLNEDDPLQWDQLYLTNIQYLDHGPDPDHPLYMVNIEFVYEIRPDPHSGYRSGFEIGTRKRCSQINVHVNTGQDQLVKTYLLIYLDQRSGPHSLFPLNGVSLLSQVIVTGHDGDRSEKMPPLEFRYTGFEPSKRKFFPLQGSDLPSRSLANPELELVDLFGNGLPDFVEMNSTVRYWRNLGEGRFDRPRFMQDAPAGLHLADPGIQFIDANGNGRTDLLVTNGNLSGYFPLNSDGAWDRQSFQRYNQSPSFNLRDPEVKLIDLDGDGITDAIRSGSRLECFFNDPEKGWHDTRLIARQALTIFPNVNFSDPRIKWADLTGDGLQQIVMVYDGSIEYWPNLGHGKWGRRVRMKNCPRFPAGYDPKRLLLGDVDGDGLADLIYVEDTKVTVRINRGGISWSDPVIIPGTPPFSDGDAVRIIDLLGTGTSGLLWSRNANGLSRQHLFFLDFTGGQKPYLLNEMDNHIGAVTKVTYAPSTQFYLKDQQLPATRWKTTLPFPVQVVCRVEVIDHFSNGKLTTEYRYHHGYWDGDEREFRGFGMVEQLDTGSFKDHDQYFSPPLLSKTWFHQGPVDENAGDWQEPDRSAEYWPGDPPLLDHRETIDQFLRSLPFAPNIGKTRRDALRALRGSILRSELYALDGSEREKNPYTVSESGYTLEEIDPPEDNAPQRQHIFYPHLIARRTTQWERGDDPMTQFSFSRFKDDKHTFDPFGRPLSQTQIACPRGWRSRKDQPAEPYLATRTDIEYAIPIDMGNYIHDRIAKSTSYEILDTVGKRIMDITAIGPGSLALRLIGQTLNFYDGEAFLGAPLQQVDKFGAVTRTESLVLTDELLREAYGTDIPPYLTPSGEAAWTTDYPPEFRSLLPVRAGYTFHAGSNHPADPTGYFVNTHRCRYDFQTNDSAFSRGLVLEQLDPLHDAAINPLAHRVLITYDEFGFLPETTTDAAGLTTLASYDYRVQQATAITDPNGNKNQFSFSPLGLLERCKVQGKNDSEGDQQRAGIRLEYGFLAFENSPPENRQPVFVRSIRNIHHDTELDVPLPLRNETITTVEYSDGFGRLLQTRTQGEEVRFGDEHFGGGEHVLPAMQGNEDVKVITGRLNTDEQNPNVVVSGWQRYNNKGQVVEKYEPFFAEGWDYTQPDESKSGQKIVLFYDPRGHTIRTLQPDGAEQWVIYGVPGSITSPAIDHPENFEPTPWEAYTYDSNDNAGRTHPGASVQYDHQWNTPSSIRIDALGRTIEMVVRNRDHRKMPGGETALVMELCTQTAYDIRGNILTITDALGRMVFKNNIYDGANNKLSFINIDAGQRKIVLNAAGNVIEQRDSKGSLLLHAYDNLNRLIRTWARDGEGQQLTLRESLEYGDTGTPNQSAAERTSNKVTNRLGRLVKHFDEAGLLTFESYDFKGNLLEKNRRVVSNRPILGIFQGPQPTWKIEAFRVDWTNAQEHILEDKKYSSSFSYSAVNCVKKITYPEDVENKRRVITPQYNRAGNLESVTLDGEKFVERIAYNAKGQRVLIAYGNGIMTRYAYDPQTLRLLRLRSGRYSQSAELRYLFTGVPMQECTYQFDLVGNILSIHDRTPGSGIINTLLGPDALDRIFTYDGLYRLRSATGRECDRLSNTPWIDTPHCQDLTQTRSYTEAYEYDFADNLQQLKHLSNGSGFTRDFGIAPGNNRLQNLTTGTVVIDYEYDANGNMVREFTSRHFEWDYADRMRVFRTQTGASEPSVHAHYLYDAAGQRVKKLVRKQGGQVGVTVYIDGIFEYQSIVSSGISTENNTLHVLDNQSNICLVRIGAAFQADTTPAIKYHLADHLGNSYLVFDDAGLMINKEEYTPFGETSFGGFARKRYRFTGKERDEESGLNYHGARYLALWLGRWISCDPAGAIDGNNLYRFSKCNPVCFADLNGRQSTPRPASGAEVPPPQPPKPAVTAQKELGTSAANAVKAQVASKGHGLQDEVTLKGGKGGSRVDIAPDPKAPQTIARTLESKYIDLNKYRTNSGTLDVSKLRGTIKENISQVVKHQLALRRGIKADLPMRESLIYTLENAKPGEALQFQDLFRAEAAPRGIQGGVFQKGPNGLSTASGKALYTPPAGPAGKPGPGVLESVAGKLGSLVGSFFTLLAAITLAEDFEMENDPGSPALGPVGTKRTDSVGTVWVKISEDKWATEDSYKY